MTATLVLVAAIAMELPEVAGKDASPAPATLEEVRAGLEKLAASWKTRDVRFAVHSKGTPTGQNLPGRLWESRLVESKQGAYWFKDRPYQEGDHSTTRCELWDGERLFHLLYRGSNSPESSIRPDQVVIKPTLNIDAYRFSQRLFYGQDWLEVVNHPDAKVVGAEVIENDVCTVVEVPFANNSPTMWLPRRLAFSPKRDFWIRRDQTRWLAKSRVEGEQPSVSDHAWHFRDFRQFDGHWFPLLIDQGLDGWGTYYIVESVKFDDPESERLLEFSVPDGVPIRDEYLNISYRSGETPPTPPHLLEQARSQRPEDAQLDQLTKRIWLGVAACIAAAVILSQLKKWITRKPNATNADPTNRTGNGP